MRAGNEAVARRLPYQEGLLSTALFTALTSSVGAQEWAQGSLNVPGKPSILSWHF